MSVDKNKSIPVVEVVSSLCVQEVCPTGRLNKSRFVDLYRKMFPEGKSAAFYEHMFRVYDADRSGTLEFSEFIQVRSVPLIIIIIIILINGHFKTHK